MERCEKILIIFYSFVLSLFISYFCISFLLLENMKNKQSLWIIVVVALIIIIAAAGYYIYQQHNQMKDLQVQSEFAKDELSDEYQNLVIEYEGATMKISNDSLVAKLETEKMKVQRLQDELRTVKATDTKRIIELKKDHKNENS